MRTFDDNKWNYADLASIVKSLDEMLADEEAMKEFHAIADEFSVAEGDGLETY
ncbi:MAG: hypothetical protein ACKVP0_14890 [Pirellulaceae bacterium]